jgi:hypothetical protein
VNGHLAPKEKPPTADTIFLSPAVPRVDIRLDNGTVIPRDMVVVTISDVSTTDAPILCFFPPDGRQTGDAPRRCNISYRIPGGRSLRPRRWAKIH